MGDVVSGHGEYRHQGHAAGLAAYEPRPLVDGGEVGVHVARETLSGGYLALGAGELAQGLAVEGHVRHDGRGSPA